MIVAYWCVLVAGVLPLACAYLAKYGAAPDGTPYDNREPRLWLARQTGLRGRADAAQGNSFEALPLFAAGVIIAVAQHAAVATVNLIAVVFVVARVAYIACYVADLPRLRSAVWVIGFGACVALFVVAATGTLR